MSLPMILVALENNIRDFFLFATPEEIEPAAKQLADFLKRLESSKPNPFDQKLLHDAVNGFNKALTSK